jgi:hypothetical protein
MDIFKVNKGVMKKEQMVKKDFSYDIDGMRLNFTLRIDIKKDLQLFLKCLDEALVDVEAELLKIDNKID